MRISKKQSLSVCLIFILISLYSTMVRSDFSSGYGLSVIGDSNVGNAVASADEQKDRRYVGEIRSTYKNQLDDLKHLTISGAIGGEHYVSLEDLSNVFVSGRINYALSNSIEFTAPRFNLSAEVQGIDVESDIRDSINYQLGLRVDARLGPRHKIAGGLLGVYNDADSDVFSTKDIRLFGRYLFDAAENGSLSLEYTYKYGDITSTGTPSLKIINASDKVVIDDAFGGLSTNQLAYRLKADTHILRVGYSHFFSKYFSLDLSLMGIYSIAREDSDLTYKRNIATARLTGSF